MGKTSTIYNEDGSLYSYTRASHTPGWFGHSPSLKTSGLNLLATGVFVALCFYDGVTGLFVLFVALMVLHGYWIGATKVGAVFVGLIAGALLGVPVGKAMEGLYPTAFHLTGALGRMVSIGLCALVIAGLVALIVKFTVYRWLIPRPRWKRYDRPLGSVMGLIEGVLIGLLFLWTLLTLEPLAATSLTHNKPLLASISTHSISQQIVDFTHTARSSAVGWLADSFNPLDEVRQLALLADGIVVLNDPDARAEFINHPALQDIQHYPSVKQALAMLADDREITLVLETGSTSEVIQTVLLSPTLLDIFDQTDILADLTPLADEIQQAINEAMEHRNK